MKAWSNLAPTNPVATGSATLSIQHYLTDQADWRNPLFLLLGVYQWGAIMMRWTRLGFSQLRHNTKQSAGRKRSKFRWTLELEALEQRDLLSTFTVTNTNDSGSGSLRQAILDSNSNPGQNTIQFQIATSGVQTITPMMALPNITNSVIIDGTTQGGYDPNNPKPLVALNGTDARTSTVR